MSKYGVGIGEEFPADDGRNGRPGFQGSYRPEDDGRHDENVHRDAHRKWRNARREWKRQWKNEWKARRREFRDSYRGAYYGGRAWDHPFYWHGFLWRALAVVAVLAAATFLFTHIYFVLGALVLALLAVAAFRHGFDPFDLPPHGYGDAPRPPRRDGEPPRDMTN